MKKSVKPAQDLKKGAIEVVGNKKKHSGHGKAGAVGRSHSAKELAALSLMAFA